MIRLASYLWLWFQFVCPLMPSLSAYRLSGVSLTLDMGYLFTAAPDLGCGVSPLGNHSWPWTWGISSQPPLLILDMRYFLSAACRSNTTQTPLRLQQYMNCELRYVQAGFRKGRGTGDQIANICWIIKKAREFKKNIYFWFIGYGKAFDCVDHNKLWKILQEMGIPDHLTCLLRNLYAGQEATVRTVHGTTEWFQIGKGVHQGCISSPCLFNLCAEYIMRNTGLDETQLESNLLGEISVTSDMQMTLPLWQKVKKN